MKDMEPFKINPIELEALGFTKLKDPLASEKWVNYQKGWSVSYFFEPFLFTLAVVENGFWVDKIEIRYPVRAEVLKAMDSLGWLPL